MGRYLRGPPTLLETLSKMADFCVRIVVQILLVLGRDKLALRLEADESTLPLVCPSHSGHFATALNRA